MARLRMALRGAVLVPIVLAALAVEGGAAQLPVSRITEIEQSPSAEPTPTGSSASEETDPAPPEPVAAPESLFGQLDPGLPGMISEPLPEGQARGGAREDTKPRPGVLDRPLESLSGAD